MKNECVLLLFYFLFTFNLSCGFVPSRTQGLQIRLKKNKQSNSLNNSNLPLSKFLHLNQVTVTKVKNTQVTNAILTTMCVSVRMLFEENAKRCGLRWKVEMGYIYFVLLGFLFHTTASKGQKAELSGSNLHQRTSVPLVADLLDTLEGFPWGCASPEAIYLIGKERKNCLMTSGPY